MFGVTTAVKGGRLQGIGSLHSKGASIHPMDSTTGIMSPIVSPAVIGVGRPRSRRAKTNPFLGSPIIVNPPQNAGLTMSNTSLPNVKERLVSLPKLPRPGNPKKRMVRCRECMSMKLPDVNGTTPKMNSNPKEKGKEGDRSKSRSKMKEKILGSPDANLLPNRVKAPKHGVSVKTMRNKAMMNGKASKTSLHHSKGLKSKSASLPGMSDQNIGPPPPAGPEKLPRGKVSVKPKIDNEIVKGLEEFKNPEEPPEATENQSVNATASPKVNPPQKTLHGETPVFEKLYSQTERPLGKHIPPGGPMMMESRSVSQQILKPEVPPDLQVVRRKTKFMMNQSLRDVYSLPMVKNPSNVNVNRLGGVVNFNKRERGDLPGFPFGKGSLSRIELGTGRNTTQIQQPHQQVLNMSRRLRRLTHPFHGA